MTSTPTDVTQDDRDAAAEYMRLFPDLRLPEAFAKHRLAHRPCDETVAALQALFDSYKDLADSGDSGFWCLEDQPVGKQALAALKSARERHRLAHQPGDGALLELLDDIEDEWIDYYLRPDSAERAKCKRCGGDNFSKSSIEHKAGCIVGRIRAALSDASPTEGEAGKP